MKKILSSIVLILIICFSISAKAKYADYVRRGGKSVKTSSTVTYKLMETFPASTITVYRAGTTRLANIYTNDAGSIKSNPFTADSLAYFEFYADAGKYDIKFSGTGITSPFTRSNIILIDDDIIVNPKSATYGAICNGGSHPLSTYFATVAEAQTIYPFITSLSQQLDYAALKSASNAAFGADGSEHGYTNSLLNKPLYIPSGSCYLGSDTWTIRNAAGIHIYGDSRISTRIMSDVAVFRTDGLWYSVIERINFKCNTAVATGCFDIDGNVPGHSYSTRSVQGNTFSNNLFECGNSTYGVIINRQGGSSAQGENLWIENHFSNAINLYYQTGFNALGNKFIRGDLQDYVSGITLLAGSINVDTTTFESGRPYAQLTSDGWDIKTGATGVYDSIVVTGVRTESPQFFKGSSSQPAVLIGNRQYFSGFSEWVAITGYSLNNIIAKNITVAGSTLWRFYYVSTAGISGASEPTWPNSGTVSDGSVVWTQITGKSVDTISIVGANGITASTLIGNIFLADAYVGAAIDTVPFEITTNKTITQGQFFGQTFTVLCNTTSGNITLTIGQAPTGVILYVKKTEASANTCTVAGSGVNIDDGVSAIIPGGSRGYITLQSYGGTQWWVLNKSF